jgi:hypothetical protein
MKILDTPRTGRLGRTVFYQSRFGLAAREFVVSRRTVTPARERVWDAVAYYSRAWATKLTEQQRQLWIVAGANVPSATRLTSGFLTGEQHFVGIHAVRACCGEPGLLLVPPARETFQPIPVTGLTIVNGEQGVRLLVNVRGPVTEDIMVFGQAPCSAGRRKRRNVAFLGLLPAPENGVSDITDLYVARYGEPKPGQKVFIVMRQHKNGWEGPVKQVSEIVPGGGRSLESEGQSLKPETGEAAQVGTKGQQAPAETGNSSKPLMYTGCTPDAHQTVQPVVPCSQEGAERGEGGGKAVRTVRAPNCVRKAEEHLPASTRNHRCPGQQCRCCNGVSPEQRRGLL